MLLPVRLALACAFLRITYGPIFEEWEPRTRVNARSLFFERVEAAADAADEMGSGLGWQQIEWLVGLLGPLLLLVIAPPRLSAAAEKVFSRHRHTEASAAKPSSQHFSRRSRAARALHHADEPPPLWG